MVFNQHVDFCLSRGVIKEAAGETEVEGVDGLGEAEEKTVVDLGDARGMEGGVVRGGGSAGSGDGVGSGNRRGRPKGKRKGDEVGGGLRGNKRLFFGVQRS